MSEANIQDIRKYLSTPAKPITMAEFKEFWTSLTEAEKDDFKATCPVGG